jgi:hypothetical protein
VTSWGDRLPVFVAGMHRSGTTTVADIIAGAEGATGLTGSGAHMGEGQFLQEVYPTDDVYGGVTRWAFDPRAHLTEGDVAPDTAERLWRAWAPYWDPDARVVVEKSPLNLVRMRFLQAAIPHARFVVVTRHPVSQALGVHKWSPHRGDKDGPTFPRLVQNWLHGHGMAWPDLDHLEHVHVVRFEHLVADPDTELAALGAFLGVDLPPHAGDALDAGVLDRYAATWDRMRRGRGRDYPEYDLRRIARRQLSRVAFPYAARRISGYAGQVRRFGYDIADLKSAEPWARTRT